VTSPIVFENVWRWFGSQVVLRGLSFRVEPGQIYALLGRNGAGKTTALRILLGFLAPLRGRARIFGVESEHLRPEQRAKIGYVGEDHRLYPTMRVRDVVAFESGTRPGFRRDLVATALARCGLLEKQRVRQLSRGQRAQLCLVLAVATTPELLICDDPALGLDVVMRRELLDALIDLLAETGCSVLLSSHFLQDVERIADRVGVLHEGRLVVDATLEDLKRRVRRASWMPREGAAPPREAQILRAAPRRAGFELSLLDADEPLLERLRAAGELAPLAPCSLEELVLDLTGPEEPGLLRQPLSSLTERDVVEVRA
jgi:ABC-2 type transport system ATP-binding protein